jgi:hypothetical protein
MSCRLGTKTQLALHMTFLSEFKLPMVCHLYQISLETTVTPSVF